MDKMIAFIKKQFVLCVTFIFALVTCFVIHPDKKYLEYINIAVIIQLFSLMTAVSGLSEAGLFNSLAVKLGSKFSDTRSLARGLVFISCFLAMFVTNDVALITIVPFTLLLLEGIKDEKIKIVTIVLEAIAANIGSMLTPVGNPQNIYLYDEFGMSLIPFFKAVFPFFVLACIMLSVAVMLIPKEKIVIAVDEKFGINKFKTVLFTLIFIVSLLCVLRLINIYVCLAFVLTVGFAGEKRAFLKVDYALLLTFVCFFIFTGNLSRVGMISDFLSKVVLNREIMAAAALSQIISNVPAAVMLSDFTTNGEALLIGVNVGGLGTPIASLASLIALQAYRRSKTADSKRFLAIFLSVNFLMLSSNLALSSGLPS